MLFAVVIGVLSAHGYWLAITIAVALLFVSPLFFYPAFLLKLIVFLAPIYWMPFVAPEVFELPQDILLVTLFFLFVLSIAAKEQQCRPAVNHAGFRLLVPFVLSLLIGVAFSSTPLASGLFWLKALQAVAFYAMLFYMVDDEETAKNLLITFAAGHTVSVAYFWFELLAAQTGLTPQWAIPYPYNFRGEGGLSFRRTAFSNTSAHILPLSGRGEPNLLIGVGAPPEGRHYRAVRAGASRSAAATAESLGGGCSGRVRCRRCSSSVWSRSGWV